MHKLVIEMMRRFLEAGKVARFLAGAAFKCLGADLDEREYDLGPWRSAGRYVKNECDVSAGDRRKLGVVVLVVPSVSSVI